VEKKKKNKQKREEKQNKKKQNKSTVNGDGTVRFSTSLSASRTVPGASGPTRTAWSLCPVRPSARRSASDKQQRWGQSKSKEIPLHCIIGSSLY